MTRPLFSLSALVLFLAACANEDSETGRDAAPDAPPDAAPDTDAGATPELASSTPADGATGIGTDTKVTLVFSEPSIASISRTTAGFRECFLARASSSACMGTSREWWHGR